jgi:hypothetical protein
MKRLLPALLLAGSLGLAACGSSDPEPTPTACLAGSDAYLAALGDGAERALLEGSVPISDCLVADQSAGEINTVGEAMVLAATELNRRVQRRPAGASARQLGYLVGSIEEGASATGGIHTDLVRRVNSAARFSEDEGTLPASFERAFGEAYAAARASG